jgi:abhydrolase domain-containing protein 12
MGTTLLSLFKRTLLIGSIPFIFLYIIVPILFNVVPHFTQHIFFLNFVKVPFVDYQNLSSHGIKPIARHFFLQEKGAKVLCNGQEPVLGVWHMLPLELSQKFEEPIASGKRAPLTNEEFENLLSAESHGIVVYFHGNSFDRTNSHRVDLYNRLSAMHFHVLAIDYRGYGDSSGTPSEDGLIEDAHFIYNYVREKAPKKPIFVWGHSMGTGVSAKFVAELSDRGSAPWGTILESPFNNIYDAVKNHPFSKPWLWWGKWYDKLMIDKWVASGLIMASDKSIQRFKCPVLIMHAADDHIIPINLGEKLAESAKKADVDVKFVEFEANLNLRHKWIHRAPHFISIVTEFFDYCQKHAEGKITENRQKEVHIDH